MSEGKGKGKAAAVTMFSSVYFLSLGLRDVADLGLRDFPLGFPSRIRNYAKFSRFKTILNKYHFLQFS